MRLSDIFYIILIHVDVPGAGVISQGSHYFLILIFSTAIKLPIRACMHGH